jgi:hypothetical protein
MIGPGGPIAIDLKITPPMIPLSTDFGQIARGLRVDNRSRPVSQ